MDNGVGPESEYLPIVVELRLNENYAMLFGFQFSTTVRKKLCFRVANKDGKVGKAIDFLGHKSWPGC